MSIEHLKNDLEKVEYLLNLLISRATGGIADQQEYAELRKKVLTNPKLENKIPKWIKIHRSLDSFWPFIRDTFPSYAKRRGFINEEFTRIMDYLELGEDISLEEVALKSIVKEPIEKTKVFIVHGRDDEIKEKVARFLERLGLIPIILHEQASGGMTIIEKIEYYSEESNFGIVLYTPCDQGRGHHEKKLPPKNRARQNVVFEHGYLMAKLGRRNVHALVKGDLEKPNDISGLVYSSLEDSNWKNEVCKELKACGYNIDINKLYK